MLTASMSLPAFADYDNVDKYSEIIKNVYKMCSIER